MTFVYKSSAFFQPALCQPEALSVLSRRRILITVQNHEGAGFMYYVYILTNKTNMVLYVGATNNLVRRVYEHKNKMVKGFTEKYNVNKLVYYDISGYRQGKTD